MQLETPLCGIELAAREAKAAKTNVILNPAPARALSDELLACIDVITPNETEAQVLTNASAVLKSMSPIQPLQEILLMGHWSLVYWRICL